MKPIKLTLLGHTPYPAEVLYAIWDATKHNPRKIPANMLPDHSTKENVFDKIRTRRIVGELTGLPNSNTWLGEVVEDMNTVVGKIASMSIPIVSQITFTILIENMPISFREQLVRHAKFIEFWIQSQRVVNCGKFYDEDNYHVPPTIRNNDRAFGIYREYLDLEQTAYNVMVDLGVPIEDARNVVGSGMLHCGSMTLSLRTIVELMRTRSCQIAQRSTWQPFIRQLCEIVKSVDPLFASIAEPKPPCVKNDEFHRCPFDAEIRARYNGIDPNPPCTLFSDRVLREELTTESYKILRCRKDVQEVAEIYQDIWNRNPWTFEKLDD